MKLKTTILFIFTVTLIVSCQKVELQKNVKVQTQLQPWEIAFKHNLDNFIAKMNIRKNASVASKATEDSSSGLTADSTVFYILNALEYLHARPTNDTADIYYYGFNVDIPVDGDRINWDVIADAYWELKDSMRSYSKVGETYVYRLVDLNFSTSQDNNMLTIHAEAAFKQWAVDPNTGGPAAGGVVLNGYNMNNILNSLTFTQKWGCDKLWNWTTPERKDIQTGVVTGVSGSKRAYSELRSLFFQRNLAILSNGCFCWSTNYFFVKIATPYAIADNTPYITYGPPGLCTLCSGYPTHVFSNFPPGSVTGYLPVPYFTAGGNDYNFTGQPDCKTWIACNTLDWYLVNLRTLCNTYSAITTGNQNCVVWSLTEDSPGNGNRTYPASYGPSCGGAPNFMGYAWWRRWDIGAYYAFQSAISLPGVTAI